MKNAKSTLKLLAALAIGLSLFACSKSGVEAGKNVAATFTVSTSNSPATKAVADGDGAAEGVNRCIMEIYYGSELYGRYVEPMTGKQSVFENIPLVSGRTYDVCFWADCATVDNSLEGFADKYYTTSDGLTAVKMKAVSYEANDDARDAFCKLQQYTVAQNASQNQAFSATLTRPFAQVNVITTDVKAVKLASLWPDDVKLVFAAPTTYNVLSNELGDSKELTVSGEVYNEIDTGKSELTLAMDYLFSSSTRETVDFHFEAVHGTDADIVFDFSSVPVQRNYRTNIKGDFLTTTGKWTVIVDPGWTGETEE